MTNNYLFLTLTLFLMCNSNFSQNKNQVVKSEKEWENQLDNLSFQVLRNSYTERPFTGEYNLHFENGNYNCKGCNQLLFSSDNKYESNCGWPSFDQAIPNTIQYVEDLSYNMKRIEVKGINVNLGDQKVVIYLEKETDIEDDTISTIFEDAGYTVETINRNS